VVQESGRPHAAPAVGHQLTLVLTVIGIAIYLAVSAASQLNFDLSTDVGIVTLLPPRYWLGLALLTVAFATALVTPKLPDWLLALCVIALIVAVFGLSAFASDVPRLNVSFRHAGIIDNLARTGSADPSIDAYFNWPGFFMLGALFTQVSGLSSPLSLALWAPLYTNLAFLPPLVLLARAFTPDRRLQWLSIWIYYLAQWVNQDYFAPQSYTYFLYLVVLAVILTWFRRRDTSPRLAHAKRAGVWFRLREIFASETWTEPIFVLTDRQRAGLFAVIALLSLATVPSHQLTPAAFVVGLAVARLLHGRSARVLLLLVGVASVGWISFMTTPYLAGHLNLLLSQMGDITAAASDNLTDRVQGSSGHLLVVRARLAFATAIWLLAAVGMMRRRRHGHRDVSVMLFAVAAYLLLPVQPYGGEMLLRCYFFSLPFLAFLAGGAILPSPNVALRPLSVAVAVVTLSTVLIPLFFIARYGNARIEQFRAAEIAGVDRMYSIADDGAALFALSNNVPWKYREYEKHRHVLATRSWEQTPDSTEVAAHFEDIAAGTPQRDLFLVTRSQEAYVEMFGSLPQGSVKAIESELFDKYGWRIVSRSEDVRLYISPT
jgi:hypothetical protein